MKIVAVQQEYPVNSYPHLLQMLGLLAASGHDAKLFCRNAAEVNAEAEGVSLIEYSLPRLMRRLPLQAWIERAWCLIRLIKLSPEIVIGHHSGYIEAISTSKLFSLVRKRVMTVLYLSDYVGPEAARWIRHAALHGGNLDGLVEVEENRLDLRSRWMKLPKNVFVVRNSVPFHAIPRRMTENGRRLRVIFSGYPFPKFVRNI